MQFLQFVWFSCLFAGDPLPLHLPVLVFDGRPIQRLDNSVNSDQPILGCVRFLQLFKGEVFPPDGIAPGSVEASRLVVAHLWTIIVW